MDIKAIMLVYKGVIQEPNLLQEGKTYLEKFLKKEPSFSFKSCQLLVSKKIDPRFRFNLGILLKNILVDNWESDPGIM